MTNKLDFYLSFIFKKRFMGEPYDWSKFDEEYLGFEKRLGELSESEEWITVLREYGEFLKTLERSVPEIYKDNFLHAKGMAGIKSNSTI